MEFEKREENPNPWTRSNLISRLFFWWLRTLLLKGRTGNLKLSDIYDCPIIDTSEEVGKIITIEWDKELRKLKEGKKPSLFKATLRGFGVRYCLFWILPTIEECFVRILQPMLLGYLIQHFARMQLLSNIDLYLCTGGMCVLAALFVFIVHPFFYEAQRTGMRLRVAFCTLVYRKSLKLSQAALQTTTVGQMVNLLTSDVNRFADTMGLYPYLIVGPLQTAIVTYVLWTHIGYASLAGVFASLLYVPFQGFMGKLFSKIRVKTVQLTDERIRVMNEIIGGMRVIKMYGWEIPFANLVDFRRRKEISKIFRTALLHGINMAIYFISSKVILLAAFVVFVLGVRGDLTPEKVFVCMALFENLRLTMTLYYPYAIAQAAECKVSFQRIQTFLLLEEQMETSQLDVTNLRPSIQQCGIWMNKINASWNKDEEATLRNVTLSVKPGELLAVVGPVGCGKTSLLMSILGELPITSGQVKVRGKVAYASQEPWVFGGSVRQNVVFGSEFNEAKYNKVLRVCALDKDIEGFLYGDQTLVGERGVTLSGGQKARVNLARAVYFDADIILLDDPLSAVDSSVSKHLFEKCVNGYLKDKVRILVTHQIQFLKGASRILVLKEGGCLALGTYEQLIKDGVDLGSLIENYEQECRNRVSSVTSNVSNVSAKEEVSEITAPLPHYESTRSINAAVDDYDEETMKGNTFAKAPEIGEEMKSSGAVKFEVYKEYIRSSGGLLLRVILFICFFVTQALLSGSDFWLTGWTNMEQRKYEIKNCWNSVNRTLLKESGVYNDTYGIFDRNSFRIAVGNVSDDCFDLTENYLVDEFVVDKKVNTEYKLSIYAALVLSIFLLSLTRTLLFFHMCMRASVALHNKMFRCVLRSPVAFFDSSPVGRILNRFAKDTGIIDGLMPLSLLDSVTIFCTLIGIICVVAIVEPWLLLPTAIMSIIFVFARRFYIPTSRDVKRYEGITRSPVVSHLTTSLHGLTTIRAFKVQRPFEIAFDHYQDQHTATWFMFLSLARWLGVYLDWLCTVYISLVTIAMVAMVVLSEDPSVASRAGLAIVSSLQLTGMFQWGVRQSAEVENQMTSVERVIEYSNLKSEAALDSEADKKPPKNWPFKGYISYQNVSLRYASSDPPVLKNLNFEVYPEEKIGIVGRTGAGKSSMIATLFRMTEPEGVIKIDGVCTKDIGLHDLRKKISIIPQDPVLFSGPIRRNLDPFSEHKDTELWQALEEAYLKEVILSMPGGLDSEVAEGGMNFSVGQRQLICLARAILRRNKILVLDEATANVDPNTDSLIQETIRDRFEHCTVLTIAHRLHTIMDSDRVLVLDAGEIKEFDDPYTLLQDPQSLFSHMVQMTGHEMAKQLREIAHAAYVKSSTGKGFTSLHGQFVGGDIMGMNGILSFPRNGIEILGSVDDDIEHEEKTHL